MIEPQVPMEAPDITARMLRQFAVLWSLFASALAWRAWDGGLGVVLIPSAAASLGLIGIFRPRIMRPVFTTLMAITAPIGFVMSKVLLGLFFYGMVSPLALIFRLVGRDVLKRRRSAAPTYWQPLESREPASYLRQS